MILRVTQRGGPVLYEWRAAPLEQERRVIDERVAYLITDILSDPEARRREFGVPSPLDIGRPAAAKTGTTTDYRDNWVAGYTPELVAAVWVGNADNRPMVDVSGISGAGPIWNEFMREVHKGQPETGFTQPAGLERVEICALSGLLPTNYCSNRRTEWFITGTAPTEPDTLYQPVEIDIATGLPADERTPESRRRTEVFVVLPPEAREWGKTSGLRILPDAALVTASAAGQTGDALRITTPPAYSTYQLAPNRPADTQRLRFDVVAPQDTRAVTYRLNGETLAIVRDAPFALWWPLALGDFQLTAIAQTGDGREVVSAPIAFAVVEYQDPIERAANRSENAP
jgi:membrane carboxypeptidase/penicillin-binding protein PbpC